MDQHSRQPFWKTPFGVISTIVAVAASVYLWLTHKDHLLAVLPFIILAVCPLMHFFMHRGHGHGGHSHGSRPGEDDAPRG